MNIVFIIMGGLFLVGGLMGFFAYLLIIARITNLPLVAAAIIKSGVDEAKGDAINHTLKHGSKAARKKISFKTFWKSLFTKEFRKSLRKSMVQGGRGKIRSILVQVLLLVTLAIVFWFFARVAMVVAILIWIF